MGAARCESAFMNAGLFRLLSCTACRSAYFTGLCGLHVAGALEGVLLKVRPHRTRAAAAGSGLCPEREASGHTEGGLPQRAGRRGKSPQSAISGDARHKVTRRKRREKTSILIDL